MSITGSVLGGLGQSLGIGNHNHSTTQMDMYNAMQQMSNQAQAVSAKPMYNFNFEEIENGWVIIFRGKKWMVNDLEELSQRVVAIMVEHKLEK